MLVQLRNNFRITCLTISSFCILMSGCSGGGGSKNPVPTVTSLSPASASAGAAPQTLTITGTGFISSAGAGFVASSTVTFNSVAHPAIYVSATQLTITLTTADQATGGNYGVVVANPYPGGGSSSAVNFTVNNPVPRVTAISPASALAGAAAQTVTVTGTGFVSTSTVTFNGAAVTPTITSSTQLTFPLTAAAQAAVGSFQVVVSNPAPGGGTSSPVSFLVTGTTLAGIVYKGASVGSTVTAYEVNADGSDGTVIGTATTASDGTFSLALTALPPGAVRLTATGGNYPSEFDASTITGTSSVSALLDTATKSLSGISITPASEFVSSYTAGLLSSKTVTDEPTAHKEAEALIGGYIGLSATAVIETLVPVFDKPSITGNPDGFTLGLYIGALATEGNQVSTLPDNLIAALSSDISDGVFDGKAFGTAVLLPDPTTPSIRMRQASAAATPAVAAPPPTPLFPTAGTTDLLLALGTYITTGSTPTKAGTGLTDVSTLENAIFGGVSNCACTPPSVGLLASSAGATTTYSLQGHQYLIVAGRQEGVVVVDITSPTTKTPPINAWPSISSTTFGGADVGGVIAVTGLSGYPEVVTFAYQSTTISILNLATLITGNPANVATDPTDNPVVLTTTLALKATSPVQFSGGEAFIAGGIPANGRGGVWLDTADGYGLLPLSSLTAGATSVTLTPLYPVLDTSEIIAENMGGDVKNNQLLGANYHGIELTDLTKGATYYLPSATLASTFPNLLQTDYFDGNSIDSNLRVGILTWEDTPYTGFLNLATVTETDSTTAGTLNTLTPAAGGLVSVNLNLGLSYGPVLSGSAVDRQSHLALFMAGYSDDMAVGLLQDPSKVPAGTAWAGLSDWSYFTLNDSPELADYGYATDPHSVGVVVNQTTGIPYGYLFDGSTDHGIVQVDLTNFLALARAGTTGYQAHQPGVDPGAAVAPTGGLVLQEFVWADPTAPIAAEKRKTQEELPNQPMIAPHKK
jgi:hypothetical protein